MAEPKTKPTAQSVDVHLDAIADETRREDCRELAALMRRVTKCEPVMWGTSIVGFGRYRYKYASGHEGETCLVGFASRKSDISLYLLAGLEGVDDLLSMLGKHKRGKGCLYLRRLADVDQKVLEKLIDYSVAETRRRYPQS